MNPPALGILTNHPFSARLIHHLHASGHLRAVAALHQHDLVAGALGSIATKLPVDRLPSDPSWKEALARWVQSHHLQAVFVLSFPHRIPTEILALPPAGFWNFHPGPLPQFRGADPVFWLLYRGASEGALSVHRMDPQFDTGPIFREVPVPISRWDTHGTHLDAVGQCAPELASSLLHALSRHSLNDLSLQSQPPTSSKPFPRPRQRHTCFHWADLPAPAIARLARAANPSHGGAKFLHKGQACQLFDAVPLNESTPHQPGTFSLEDPETLCVACADHSRLRLLTIGTPHGFFHAPHWFASCPPDS